MTRDEILKLAEKAELCSSGPTKNEHYKKLQETIQNQCLVFAEYLFANWDNETKPAKVSALEFVTITMEKEHLIGRPIIWAEWPSKEQA
jgi:hypothetical protein